MQFDLTTFAGVAAATTGLIGAAKNLFPKWVTGREPMLALVLGLGLTALSKTLGWGFAATGWLEMVIAGVGAGVGAGLIHDKVINAANGKTATPPAGDAK